MKGGKRNEEVGKIKGSRVVAKAALGTAKTACGAESFWDLHQPKEPAALKKMMKNK